MKRLATALTVALLSGPALAIECPIPHAIYEQPGGAVSLRFAALPEHAGANQIGEFTIKIEGVAARLEGRIYIPNGFGQPHGFIGEDCTGAEGEECEFWDGIVYALGADGIVEYPWDPDAVLDTQLAPQQILLPEFASALWYSMLREEAFAGERMMLDTFTLVACAK